MNFAGDPRGPLPTHPSSDGTPDRWFAANAEASGVRTTSGRLSFITIHGTTAIEMSPGTIAAAAQLAQVI